MTSAKAVIGRGARVQGRVTGSDDLDIDGRVDGEVQIDGEVLVDANGLVAANVTATVITVRGAVKGDLTAREAVRLEEGARVVGDLRAPRIAIAPGARMRGRVQTGNAEASVPRRTTAVAPATRSTPTQPAPRAAAAPPARSPAPPPRPAVVREAAQKASKPVPSAVPATPRTAPPPIVPSLKKGTKAALKKKA